MSDDLQIRVGEQEDAAVIADIGRTAFESEFINSANRSEVLEYTSREYNEAAIIHSFQKSEVTFLVAERQQQVIGFAQLVDEAPQGRTDTRGLKVERLYQYPEHIGTGCGLGLMKAVKSLAMEREIDLLWLMVLRPNERAVRFYKEFGMTTFGESPGKFKADAEIDFWMKLDLST